MPVGGLAQSCENGVEIGKFPSVVSLSVSGKSICGGVILGTKHILTTAHCVENVSLTDLRVVAGIVNWTALADGEIRDVKNIQRHPGYISEENPPCTSWKCSERLVAELRYESQRRTNDIAVLTVR